MILRITTLCCLFTATCEFLTAGDWPQILGPDRNGIAINETLLKEWPESGPGLIWSLPVGEGFAGVAVKGDTLALFHRKEGSEIVEAIQAVNGKPIWTSPAACDYRSGMSSDSGPRCVPIVAEKRVYTFGANGMLRCVNLQDGKEVWRRDTWDDFGAPEGYFGAGSTPILVDDKIIVNVGGRTNAAVVAFSIADGKTVWQNVDDTASYSSPILTSVDGQEHVIFVTRLKTVSFNPIDGSVRFEFPFGARGPTVNGATPVMLNDSLFVSSSYRVGSVLAKVTAGGADPRSSGETLLATQYATPIRYNNVLFAVDGRQDIGPASLCCIDPVSENVLWRKDGFDYGTLIRVQDELLFLTCEGTLIRFKADTQKYSEVCRHQILESTSRGYRLPALSNGFLYVRDNSMLKCFQVGKAE
jgi:outer membrane protein assembly factor BamB